jgi:hypothetical protein
MLSFLRDPNLEELPAEKNNGNEKPKEKEYLSVATNGKDVRKSTTILGVLFIIGLICLGVMIKKSSPQAASAETVDTEQVEIETAIARLMGIKSEMFNRMDEIVSKFYEFSDVLQVQVGELAKNPFQIEMFLTSLTEEPVENETIEIDPEKIRQERIRQKAKDMKLYSTMQSEKGVCCMIDNEILYEGDFIGDFQVKKIGNNIAILEFEGVEITLKLSK